MYMASYIVCAYVPYCVETRAFVACARFVLAAIASIRMRYLDSLPPEVDPEDGHALLEVVVDLLARVKVVLEALVAREVATNAPVMKTMLNERW